MNEYRHHVSGFFAHHVDAEYVLAELLVLGLPRERLYLLNADSAPRASAQHADDNRVLTHVLVDGAIGTAVGTGIGVLAELALVAANVSLFIASPLIAPLAMLGWGASLGGLVGAAVGAESHAGNKTKKKGTFSALIRDAISSGQVVLVAETRTERETASARQVMRASVGACEDVSTV
ncbi:MAG: hypothetical protein A2045_10010 [Rhodocyclales bacterium GWA2_65_20]|nr:MAG: hypothetical protein A2045_10010 [Rhodocyclales bacterium GWA2_65_20]